jgi:4-carboxymuconolactone decarboxylase
VNSRPGRAGPSEWLAAAVAGDPAVLPDPALGAITEKVEESGLDMRTYTLVRLAALVAAHGPGMTYDEHIAAALDHGVTPDEITGVLVVLLSTMGSGRVTAAAPPFLNSLARVTADVPGPGVPSA